MGCDDPATFAPDVPEISIHASRMGCDLSSVMTAWSSILFQSTHPVWDATRIMALWCDTVNFNPRIPYGMRRPTARAWSASSHFNPRIPYGMRRPTARAWSASSHFNPRIPYGMRLLVGLKVMLSRNFNPRIPYGMRRTGIAVWRTRLLFQSTHPVWDATASPRGRDRQTAISIHASRMGCDIEQQPISAFREFQSTHPVWDATFCRQRPSTRYRYFNPRIPYGMRPPERRWSPARSYHFNPRIPYGMRQSGVNKWTKAVSISIHASRMGCDMRRHPAPFGCRNFNPRIPYGMRPPARIMAWCSTNFNPRIPYGMRRHVSADPAAAAYFNPRIPYGMRLIFLSLASVSCRYFNPRIPYGMRQIRKVKMLVLREFQSTHPVWDATSCSTASARCGARFQSTHPVWDATQLESGHRNELRISIHASRMGCDPSL